MCEHVLYACYEEKYMEWFIFYEAFYNSQFILLWISECRNIFINLYHCWYSNSDLGYENNETQTCIFQTFRLWPDSSPESNNLFLTNTKILHVGTIILERKPNCGNNKLELQIKFWVIELFVSWNINYH